MTAKTIYDGLDLGRYSWIFIALIIIIIIINICIYYSELLTFNVPGNGILCFIYVGARTVIIVVAKCIHYHDVAVDGDPQILCVVVTP